MKIVRASSCRFSSAQVVNRFPAQVDARLRFHLASVWPIPRTQGCLRPPQNAAREFFDLARVSPPVYIAQTQPENATLGHNSPRLQDYGDPPKSIFICSTAFKDPAQHLREQF